MEEFRSICPTVIWRNTERVFAAMPVGVRAKVEARLLKLQLWGRFYDLVYLNTASTASHMPVLSRLTKSTLWHIHELEYAIRKSMSDQQRRQLLPLATRIIAVSNCVRDTLISEFGVYSNVIDVVNGFVSVPCASLEEAQSLRKRIHREFNWPDDAFVIGGCGALGWRKGSDVFLQVAECLLRSTSRDRTRLLWVGGGSADEELRFRHDVRALGLEGYCCYVPSTPAVMNYYYAMDVFALTSREDPFPLVMLEAASRDLPIVCFAGSGGAPEFVGDECGCTVRYLDVPAFAECLKGFINSPELCRKYGAAAAAKVRSEYIVDLQGPKVLNSIQRCLATMPERYPRT